MLLLLTKCDYIQLGSKLFIAYVYFVAFIDWVNQFQIVGFVIGFVMIQCERMLLLTHLFVGFCFQILSTGKQKLVLCLSMLSVLIIWHRMERCQYVNIIFFRISENQSDSSHKEHHKKEPCEIAKSSRERNKNIEGWYMW